MELEISDFDFDLPESSIAKHPADRRDASRLMVLDSSNGSLAHRRFLDLPELLAPEDLLVVNDARVLPARLEARKAKTGGHVEILLVEAVDSGRRWRAMVQASKAVRKGAVLALVSDPSIAVTVAEEEGEGFVVLDFPEDAGSLARRHGALPIPPYLRRRAEPEDEERYQTIFARAEHERSVAAPTAGLHFSPEVLAALALRRVSLASLTLDVGPGTFLPVRTERIEAHRMLPERYVVPEGTVAEIERTRARGGRVIAVGTTVTRVLETLGRPAVPGGTAAPSGSAGSTSGATDLFILPGYRFKGIDSLVTNFHLPRSTLLMLVCALAGRELTLSAYREAVREGYRFYSYGDAMLIV